MWLLFIFVSRLFLAIVVTSLLQRRVTLVVTAVTAILIKCLPQLALANSLHVLCSPPENISFLRL